MMGKRRCNRLKEGNLKRMVTFSSTLIALMMDVFIMCQYMLAESSPINGTYFVADAIAQKEMPAAIFNVMA